MECGLAAGICTPKFFEFMEEESLSCEFAPEVQVEEEEEEE